jgi:septin 7
MLVRTHMEELREHTNDVLYENYRTQKLLAMGVAQDHSVFKEIKWVLEWSVESGG